MTGIDKDASHYHTPTDCTVTLCGSSARSPVQNAEVKKAHGKKQLSLRDI